MRDKNTRPNNNSSNQYKQVDLKTLLECGSHFGSNTSTWNPKMAPYIYGVRNGIYILDLDTTIKMWRKVKNVVVNSAAKGEKILFIATKQQSRESLVESATKCGSPFVHYKWSAGTLTNFSVMRKSVDTMIKYEEIIKREESVEGPHMLVKKEVLYLKKKVAKMENQFGGLRDLKNLPSLIFVSDVNKEKLAVNEARILGIPVIALLDSDSNPEDVDYPIPANDDAKRSLELFIREISNAVIEGKAVYQANTAAKEADKAIASSSNEPQTVEEVSAETSDKNITVEKKKAYNPKTKLTVQSEETPTNV